MAATQEKSVSDLGDAFYFTTLCDMVRAEVGTENSNRDYWSSASGGVKTINISSAYTMLSKYKACETNLCRLY